MLYKNICGINLNLIKAALFIGTYDIFGTITLIILEIEFFSQSTYFAEVNENNLTRRVVIFELRKCVYTGIYSDRQV